MTMASGSTPPTESVPSKGLDGSEEGKAREDGNKLGSGDEPELRLVLDDGIGSGDDLC